METVRISVSTEGRQGNDDSSDPCVSADGSRVSFSTLADSLIDTDTNAVEDVYLRDLVVVVPCLPDRNGDGLLDFFDVAAFTTPSSSPSFFSANDPSFIAPVLSPNPPQRAMPRDMRTRLGVMKRATSAGPNLFARALG